MSDWDDEELTTIAPFAYHRAERVEDDDNGLHWSRISGKDFTPPPGLKRRARRRWVRDARRSATAEQRDHNRSVAARLRGQVGDGLGVPLLIVAIIVAAYAFWPRQHHAPAAPPSSPASTPSAGVDTSPTSAAADPSGPIGTGTDDTPPTSAPAALSSPAGLVAYRFLLSFDTYNPANPDPVGTWESSWEQYASTDLAGQAQQLAGPLWADLATRRLSATAGDVTACTVERDTGSDVTWSCDVAVDLFPIGGSPATPYTQQTRTYRVEEAGTDTTDARVTTVALLTTAGS